ncbi:hypothetical protein ACFVH6_17280 [Spirillospora sp. NPDC127200]
MKFPKSTLLLIPITAMALSGCSGEKKKSPTPSSTSAQQPAPSTPSPPPTFTSAQTRKSLILPKEVGPGMQEIKVIANALQDRKIPICSLATAEISGKPEIITRQLSNKAEPQKEVKYTQVVARYDEANEARTAYTNLRKRTASCPPKQHVKPKKIRENFTLFAHDDTWKIREEKISGWEHVRGIERQEYSSSTSKYNILHVMYDYAVRGNLLIATLYYERTEPGKSGAPIEQRATKVLTKQLQKIG